MTTQPFSTNHILLIDDDLNLVRSLEIYLNQQYTVLTAPDGRSGVKTAHNYEPSLIILDISLPDISGYDVLEQLQASQKTATIPVILMTGHGTSYQDVRHGMGLGADDYLIKPFTLDDLDAAIKARLRKQSEVNRKLDTTIRVLRENLTYALPHELKTPLFQIMGYADLLRMDVESTSSSQTANEYIDAIMSASQRLQAIVENYILYIQLEAIADNPTRRAALRNHVLKDAAKVIRISASTAATLYNRLEDVQFDVQPQALRMSEENLSKLIAELVDNALKFSEPGQVIQVRTFRQDKHYIIIVADKGRGIEADEIRRLGAPFIQFNRQRHEQKGVGLGFAIVAQLVALHDGDLEVHSLPDKGAQVHIKLPLY